MAVDLQEPTPAPSGGGHATVGASFARVMRRVAPDLSRGPSFAVRFWDGSVVAPPGEADDPDVTFVVRSPDAIAHILREPNDLGLGRAWVSGQLDLEGDPETGLSVGERFGSVDFGLAERASALAAARSVGAIHARRPPIPAAEARLRRRGRRHSLARDRAAISHHYDVSNRFYELILGPSMVYSCAYFGSPDDTLETAQERKLELICAKLRLREGQRLLDVGCGWGSLVLHAARHHGVRAVGVTLSTEQAAYANARIREAGLADRCEVRVADYRETTDGPYDRIASVGMVEHVGRGQLVRYGRQLYDLLAPGGLFLNHGIVRPGRPTKPTATFAERYVFPDGELGPLPMVLSALEEAGFEARDVESLREHYALTLRRWVANLQANRDAVTAEAGTERERVWLIYMLASARLFERNHISVVQTLLSRRVDRGSVPLTRRDLVSAL